MTPRALLTLAGTAAGLAAVAWVWRRYGVGFAEGVPTGVVKLVEVEGVTVLAEEAATVRAMLEDARRVGVPLQLNSAFRGWFHQAALRALYLAGLRQEQAASPGYSNHQRAVRSATRGPALDIAVGGRTDSKEFRWLQENGPKYGLKMVGVSFGEPWHVELVKGK